MDFQLFSEFLDPKHSVLLVIAYAPSIWRTEIVLDALNI